MVSWTALKVLTVPVLVSKSLIVGYPASVTVCWICRDCAETNLCGLMKEQPEIPISTKLIRDILRSHTGQ
jgi:hypothetical protein